MDDYCAPQWTDFTRSPQVPSDSYFEVEHKVHEPLIKQYKKYSAKETAKKESDAETNFDDSLEPEETAPTNVAYFIPHNNKKSMENENSNASEAAAKPVKLDEKSRKSFHAWNVSVHELTSALKAPNVITVPKVQQRTRKSIHTFQTKNAVHCKLVKNTQALGQIKEEGSAQVPLHIKNGSRVKTNFPKQANVNPSRKRLSYKVVQNRRNSNSFTATRHSLGKSQSKVLTCQYRRRSLIKYRRCSNQFISFAEAVSKFQNGTPQRFRTISNKDTKLYPPMKFKQAPLKLTYPHSPTLRCKQRARQTTVLSQEEREALQLEEMKKNQIKANPVPVNILKGPVALKKVTKKPATIPEEFHLTQSKKTRHTIAPQINSQQVSDERKQNLKPAAPMTRSTSASSVTLKKNDAPSEHSTDSNSKSESNTVPSSFETRNKEFRMRRGEKLRNLQEKTSKVKAEFHARPVPNFSKPTNPIKNPEIKKAVTTCPFSFEERNKNLARKKEEFVKQMQEQNNKTRIFHANRVPIFKPVLVHGLSKENIRGKEKTVDLKDLSGRQTRSCNDQENKQPNIIVKPAKAAAQNIVNDEPEEKPLENISNTADSKNEKAKAAAKKVVAPKFELNTDKRAKERNEFDTKLKKKEEELEVKKQEEEKNRLLKEKMERAELRRKTEIKARPMPVYKPMVAIKCTKPPTSPRSPALGIKAKTKRIVQS